MTETAQLQLLDFNSPRKPRKQKWRALSKWHESMCVLSTESWNALLTQKMTIASAEIEPAQWRTALQKLPTDAVGLHFVIGSS